MSEYVLLVALTMAWSLGRTSAAADRWPSVRRVRRRVDALIELLHERGDLVVAVLAFALVATFALQLRVEERAAAIQLNKPPWYDALPLPVLGPIDIWKMVIPGNTPSLAIEAVVVMQTAALVALAVAFGRLRTGRRAVIAVASGSLALIALAIGSRVLSSTDIYAYVGYARLGLAAYAPPHVRFPGEAGILNDVWGTPLVPSLYGPLWLGFARLVAGNAPSVAGAIHALQLGGAVALGALVLLLSRLGASAAVLAVTALNPMLVDQFVANAHNDLLAIVLIMLAFIAWPRRGFVAAILVATAGLVKLPFVAIGLLAFACGPYPRRVAFAFVALALCVAVSVLVGSGRYVADVSKMSGTLMRGLALGWRVTHWLLGGAALIGVALSVLAGRRWPPLAWCFPMLSGSLFPWYLSWGMPYALATRTLVPMLCILPLAAFAVQRAFPPRKIVTAEALALAIVIVVAVALRWRRVDGAGERQSTPRIYP